MDTIQKAIWGQNNNAAESGTEPIAGEQGPGTPSRPYDKGNEDIQQEEDAKNAAAAASASNVSASQRDVDGPSDATDQTGDPTSGAQPAQKQQGADRPTESPPAAGSGGPTAATGSNDGGSGRGGSGSGSGSGSKVEMPHTDEEREALMQKGEFPHDPDDHSGEPMRMHGAPASSSNDYSKDGDGDGDGAASGEKTGRSASVAQEGGGPHGRTLGTGEKYVKSSGMAADGGDFDATKPGAGAEATRLMEEAGVKTEGQQAPSAQKAEGKDVPAPEEDGVGEKQGKLTKLKEKLRIGKAN